MAATLLSAGAAPTVEDQSGASALVNAVDAQEQLTLKVGKEGGESSTRLFVPLNMFISC